MTSVQTGSVFVIGADIGEGVAKAFSRGGYTVYGLVRKEEQAKLLLQSEVIPVIGDATNSATWKQYVEKAHVIIDATTLPTEHEKVARNVFEITDKLQVDPIYPPKVFIYTSGIMVYGHDERWRDENWPTGTNSDYSQWRAGVERYVLSQKSVTPIVIRPGWVYGQRLSNNGLYIFGKPGKLPEKLILYGERKDRRYSWIHVEDLGDFFVAAAKQGIRVRGEVFNAVGYDTPKWSDLITKGHVLAGFKDSNVILNPQKGIDLLHWTPKHVGFLEHLDFYYEVYKSYQK